MAKVNPIFPGEKFGKLTVLLYSSEKKAYICQCECGKQTTARSHSLRTRKHSSCGCGVPESTAQRFTKPNFEAFKNEILKNYKQAAKRRGYEFDLLAEGYLLI